MAVNNTSSEFNEQVENIVQLFGQQKTGVKTGDVVQFEYTPGQGVSYHLNEVKLAEVDSPQLFKMLLRAWIGQVPPSSEFRQQILSPDSTSSLIARFEAIKPSADRVDQVKSWLQAEEPEKAEAETGAEQIAETKSKTPALTKTVVANKPATKKVKAETQAQAADKPKQPAKQVAASSKAKTKPALKEVEKVAAAKPTAPAEEDDAEEEAQISIQSILAMKDYTSSTLRALYKHIRYPTTALYRGLEGQVSLLLSIDRDGELINVTPSRESKHSILTKAALKAAKRAAPFENVPDVIADTPLEITIPVRFQLEQ